MNDEELERLLRRHNPVRSRQSTVMDMRHAAILNDIVAAKPRVTRWSRPRLALSVSVPLVLLLAIVVTLSTVIQPFGAQPAAAFGPSPLKYEPISGTPTSVVEDATQRLAELSGPSRAVRGSKTTGWNLSVNQAGEAAQVVAISPSVIELAWAEDLSGTMLTTAGRPYFADDELGSVPSEYAVAEGEILDDRTFGVGEYSPVTPEGERLGPREFEALFRAYAPVPGQAGDAFYAVQAVLSEWTLSTPQHAAMLEALLAYDDIRLLGHTTDRAGRAVVGLAAPASGGETATLFVSERTGAIVGIERAVVDPGNSLAVPAGTVISYTLWEDLE